FIFTVTAPPPELASKMVLCICDCSSCACFCALTTSSCNCFASIERLSNPSSGDRSPCGSPPQTFPAYTAPGDRPQPDYARCLLRRRVPCCDERLAQGWHFRQKPLLLSEDVLQLAPLPRALVF